MPTWPKPNPRQADFNCNAAWHLRKSGLYIATYDLIANVTSGGENKFFSSIQKVADYFGVHYETQRRVFLGLRKQGWLIHLDDGNDQWVHHRDRAKAFPDGCLKRDVLVWQPGQDKLVGQLWAVCDGKFKLYSNHLVAIRKYGCDNEILDLFRKEIEAAKAAKARGGSYGAGPKAAFFTVLRYMKKRAAENQAHQNGQSHR